MSYTGFSPMGGAMRPLPLLVLLAALALGLGCERGGSTLPPPKDVPLVESPSFKRDILPILKDFCVKCHSPRDAHAGLRLDTYEGVMRGSRFGPVVVPGSPERSFLLLVLRHQLEPFMPYHGEMLTPNRITNIERWIKQGAPDN